MIEMPKKKHLLHVNNFVAAQELTLHSWMLGPIDALNFVSGDSRRC